LYYELCGKELSGGYKEKKKRGEEKNLWKYISRNQQSYYIEWWKTEGGEVYGNISQENDKDTTTVNLGKIASLLLPEKNKSGKVASLPFPSWKSKNGWENCNQSG